MPEHPIDFRTPTNAAFKSLGALPPGQHWSRFDVPQKEAARGGASVLVTTIWNFHWQLRGSKRTRKEPAIYRDVVDRELWYRMERPGRGAPPTSASHWNRITLARELKIPIIGVLKDFSTSRCSLADTFRCQDIRDDVTGDAVWLHLKSSRPLASEATVVDIRLVTAPGPSNGEPSLSEVGVIEAVIRPQAASVGQSPVADGARRLAIELYAMAQAIAHYKRSWRRVVDVSAKECFDLLCTDGSRELRVEVKGTTTTGKSILLTRNEVRHVEDPSNRVALFVVSEILVDSTNTCSSGVSAVTEPWTIDRTTLSPIAYEYDL